MGVFTAGMSTLHVNLSMCLTIALPTTSVDGFR